MDKPTIIRHLHDHLTMLTRTIGERSVRRPRNLESAAAYIEKQLAACGIPPGGKWRSSTTTTGSVCGHLFDG